MISNARKRSLPILALLLCAALSACSWNFPYSIPIQQGNVITVEMVQELELGMDKRKVRFILGTPLVIDAFHQDRWDYFYSYEHGLGDPVQQRASMFFEGDRLVRIDADIDSRIDFYTVTDASENVIIVPKKEKGGFFAAITPAFVAREEEAQREAAIARTLDTGFNEAQPGSASSGETPVVEDPVGDTAPEPTLDAALAAPAVIGPGLGDDTTPSELYAPNSSTQFDTTGAWSAEPAHSVEVLSAETESQSRYLENLFAGFGTAPAPTPSTATAAEPAAETSVLTEPVFAPQPTRD